MMSEPPALVGGRRSGRRHDHQWPPAYAGGSDRIGFRHTPSTDLPAR
jgi:hypothetical protein